MVNTRRSVFATPTIPVARALRRERRARIAEAEILPQSQSIPTQPRNRKKSKSVEVPSKATKKNKECSVILPTELEPVPQITNNIDVDVDSIPQDTQDLESVPPATQNHHSVPEITQSFESVPQFTQVNHNVSPDPSTSSRQASVQPLPPDAFQNPLPSSHPHETQNTFESASQFKLSQASSYRRDDESMEDQLSTPNASQNPPPPTQPQEAPAKNWFGTAPSTQISLPNPAAPIFQPAKSLKNWFGTAPSTQISLPNPAAPIFQPAKSLFHFAAGAPVTEEPKPFDHGSTKNARNDALLGDDFLAACGSPADIAASFQRKHEMTSKAATAVMARMNGHSVSRSEYLSILDGMLQDPDMQVQLPPVLLEKYETATKEEATTLYNGGLIDKFVKATDKATNITAKILLTSKNTKKERKARGARNRSIFSHSSAQSSSMGPYDRPAPMPSSSNLGPATSAHPMAAPPATQPSRNFPPLTEANLNRAPPRDLFEEKARANPSLCDEDRGVVRTTKGFVRASPYPRRASTDTLRMAQALANQNANTQRKESHDECGYSVYSASSGALYQQTEAKRVAKSILDGVKGMHEPGSYDAQCVRNAEAILEETARKKGKHVAASVRRGFDLLHCYDLLKQVNVGLLSDALLEHISDELRPPRNNPQPSHSGGQIAQTRAYHDIAQPPAQFCEHAQLGWGFLSFAKVFHPIGSNERYTETISHNPLP